MLFYNFLKAIISSDNFYVLLKLTKIPTVCAIFSEKNYDEKYESYLLIFVVETGNQSQVLLYHNSYESVISVIVNLH